MKYTPEDIEKIYQDSKNKLLPTKNSWPVQTVVRKNSNVGVLPTKAQQELSFTDKITQPIKNIKSNYTVGKLSEEENQAWSKYRSSQSQDNLKLAQNTTDVKTKYIEKNKVGQGNLLTKDFAQYVPQMIGQIGSGLKGAGDTALKGAAVGAGTALIAGQMGPQVLAPEELITVPGGAITGAVFGGKAGYMKGVAEYSYDSMAGSAYKGLIDLGVPNNIALKVSGDEALVSSLIEAAGAGVDIASLGIGKLLSKGGTNAASKVAKNKLVSALKAYGINIASEGLEEGLQEKVSIESEKKAMGQSGIIRTASEQEDLQRILESAKGGAAIATISGGGNAIGNVAVNTINNRQIKNNQMKNYTSKNIDSIKTQNIDSSEVNTLPVQEIKKERFIPRLKAVNEAFKNENFVETQNEDKINDIIARRKQSIAAKETSSDVIQNIPISNSVEINTSSKAQKYQKRQENYFVKDIADSLGISRYADKSSLKGMVNELTTELKTNEVVAPEKIDKLFNTIVEDGIQVDFSFYNKYRDLKDQVRNTKLYVSDDVKADFDKGEYNSFRKTNLGNLTLTKDKGSMQIDSYYQELSENNPDFFPKDIVHPADQLRQIADVQNSIVKTENNLALYIDNDVEYKEWARREFDVAVEKLSKEAKQVKKVQDEKAARIEEKAINKEMVANTKAEDMHEVYRMKQMYQKQYDSAVRKEILTKRDSKFVDMLVDGDITIDDLPSNVNKGGIINIYKTKEPLKNIDKSIKDYNRSHKSVMREKADELISNTDTWKDKASGFQYQRETMERNIRDIVPNKQEANAITETYFTPIHENEAKATKLKNSMRDVVRKINLQNKNIYEVAYEAENGLPFIKKVSERALVQLLGEGKIKNDMIKKSGADVNKIENAVKEFRGIYDKLITESNNVLIENGYSPVEYRKDYFPHFTDDKPDNLLNKIGRLVGIDVDTKELPMDIAGLTHTFKPGKRWVGNFLQRTSDVTEYDAVQGFDRYIEGVSDVIHHTEDIQRLRALEDSLRYKHSSDGIKAEIDKIREIDTISELDKVNRIEEIYKIDKSKLPHFVTELRNYTDNLAGKKALGDRDVEHVVGRKIYGLAKWFENRVASNMVAVNPGSWLTNFIPLTQGMGGVKTTNLLNGMKDTISSYAKNDMLADRSTFLVNRKGSEPLIKTKLEKVSNTLSSPMQIIDSFTSETLVRARYYENMRNGMPDIDAMKDADKWVAGVMADRSKGSLPTKFNKKNPASNAFNMFQLEVNNQLSYYFKDVPDDLKEKGVAALAMAFTKMFVGSWLYNQLYEKLTGRRAALDPIDLISTAIGDFKDKDKKTYQAVANTAKGVVQEMPFVGGLIGGGRLPISSAIPDVENTVKSITGLATGEMPTNKALNVLGKEVAKPATYFLLPFGGGQVKKAVEGISTVNKGGSFGIDSQGRDTLQFPVEKNLGNYAKSSLFGKYSLPTAKDYIDSGFKSLSGPYTEKYKDALSTGFTSDQFLNSYKAQKEAESDKDRDGNTIYLSLASNKKKAIDDANKGMSKERLEKLYSYFDVSEKLWKDEVKKDVKKDKQNSLPTIKSITVNRKLPTIKKKE